MTGATDVLAWARGAVLLGSAGAICVAQAILIAHAWGRRSAPATDRAWALVPGVLLGALLLYSVLASGR